MTCHGDSIFPVPLFHDVEIDNFVSGQLDIKHENTKHNCNITKKFKDYDDLTDDNSEIGSYDQDVVKLDTLLIIGQDSAHGSAITSTKIQRHIWRSEEETNGSKYPQDASNHQLNSQNNELDFREVMNHANHAK